MNIMDAIVLGLLCVSLWIGWRRGFVRTIMGPVSMAVCVYAAYYYLRTAGLVIAVCISLLGPVVIALLMKLARWILYKPQDKAAEEGTLTMVNHWLGMAASFGWAVFLIWVTYLAVVYTYVPVRLTILDPVYRTVINSTGYRLFCRVSGRDTLCRAQQSGFQSGGDGAAVDMDRIRTSEEYTRLITRPEVKRLFENETFLTYARERNFSGIIQDKEFQQILADPEVLKDFMKLYQRMVEVQSDAAPEAVK